MKMVNKYYQKIKKKKSFKTKKTKVSKIFLKKKKTNGANLPRQISSKSF